MYFAMLRHPNGKPIALVSDDGDFPAMYETEEEAKKAAESSSLGDHFGYEIYEW
jgi:hypothetical protein